MIKRSIWLILLLILAVGLVSPIQADESSLISDQDIDTWLISPSKDGNKIYIDTADAYISATPEVLKGSGWVEFEINSKSLEGAIDLVFGFETSTVQVKQVEIWIEDAPHIKTKMESYKTTCYDENEKPYQCDSYHKVEYIEYYDDYVPISNNISINQWKLLEQSNWHSLLIDRPISKNTRYKFRCFIEQPFLGLTNDPKLNEYFIGFKPNNKSLSVSKLDKELFILDPWLAGGWGNRIKLTINNNLVGSDLSNFPLPVYLSTSSGTTNKNVSFVFDELGANSHKIAVTKSDGTTECYVEVENWNSGSETAWLWVNAGTVSSTANTILYLYYDSTHADNDTYVGDTNDAVAENVWDEHFKGVYHMADGVDDSHIYDSTSNDNDGTKTESGGPAQIASKVAYGQYFDANNDEISFGTSADFDFTGDFSIELWGWRDVDPLAANDAGFIKRGNWNQSGYYIENFAAGGCTLRTFQAAANQQMACNACLSNASTWYYMTFTLTTTTGYVWLNGVQNATNPAMVAPATRVDTLKMIDGNKHDGQIDELRFSDCYRTLAWHTVSYLGMTDDLIRYGDEESAIPDCPSNLDAIQNATTIDLTWTAPTSGTTNTVIYAKCEDYPAYPGDGDLVYSGTGTSATHDDLSLINDFYYTAWGERDGVYSTCYDEEVAEGIEPAWWINWLVVWVNFTEESFMVIAFVILALGMMVAGYYLRHASLVVASGIVWLIFAIWAYQLRSGVTDIYFFLFWLGILMAIIAWIEGATMPRNKDKVFENDDYDNSPDDKPEPNEWDSLRSRMRDRGRVVRQKRALTKQTQNEIKKYQS